jgi:hypothetical protein
VQTAVEDAKVLAAAKKGAKLVILEGMNHTLKLASTQEEQVNAYYDASVPLAPNLRTSAKTPVWHEICALCHKETNARSLA